LLKKYANAKSRNGNDGVICLWNLKGTCFPKQYTRTSYKGVHIYIYIYIYSNKVQAKLNDSRTREYVDDDAFVFTVYTRWPLDLNRGIIIAISIHNVHTHTPAHYYITLPFINYIRVSYNIIIYTYVSRPRVTRIRVYRGHNNTHVEVRSNRLPVASEIDGYIRYIMHNVLTL